jgi:hypothetical protein
MAKETDVKCAFNDDERKAIQEIIVERGHLKYIREATARWTKYLIAIPPALLGLWVATQTLIQKIVEASK